MATNFPPSNAGAPSPIADLTYRNYDGPLQTRAVRWWIVALAGLRINLKKKGFWINSALIFLPGLITGLMLYFQVQAPQIPGLTEQQDVHTRFARAFFNMQSGIGILAFSLALQVGTGIASDNSANALLVYLSKPITKGDYLLGKWASIFLLIFGALAAPALLLYLFCLTLFLKDGFLSNEPLLILRILMACALPAVLYASILVGISSWSKSPQMANAFTAGLYFVSLIVSGILYGIFSKGDPSRYVLLRHASVNGIISGLLEHIYNVSSQVPRFGRAARMHLEIPSPPLWPLLIAAVALTVIGIGAARMKVRAVEVIRG